ncbi:MAG TPA: penicillin-binding transpeptidase domain-containing protein [Thermoleophilaceae bacterium]|nr:penicillin-binding transpeptidase domain-containing protein [Thermoleophilaceae bacterium]
MSGRTETGDRRRRLLRRGLPALILLAGAATFVVLAIGAVLDSDADDVAARFGAAWDRGDTAAMYALLTPAAKAETSQGAFEEAYRDAAEVATVTGIDTGEAREGDDGGAVLPVAVRTRAFGTLRGELELGVSDGGIAWERHHVLPGIPRGAALSRRTEAPPRARILSRDGKVIAEGPADARTHPAGPVAAEIAGSIGPVEDKEARRVLYSYGLREDQPTGLTGLERALESKVVGTPGGQLIAGGRVLASTRPRPAPDVRSTIDLDIQAAADQALAGRLGGIAALDARTAEVRALAGIAFSAPQPPGSTFKIVTTAAALEARLVKPGDRFPVETHAVIDGVELDNANRESCGGTFVNSFAHSCNSVFAPLGVRLGKKRLVAMAERFGWNREPGIAGAARSTLPAAGDIASELELGATAIGQGRVLATPLIMAQMAQAVASRGVLRPPVLVAGARRPKGVRVMSRRTADIIERLMIAVVESGTGQRASLAPTKVAGKTGTAELEDTTVEDDPDAPPEPPGFKTDAWFTAYAPIRRPELAVGVLFVRNGSGGDTAAPAARIVLQAALAKR